MNQDGACYATTESTCCFNGAATTVLIKHFAAHEKQGESSFRATMSPITVHATVAACCQALPLKPALQRRAQEGLQDADLTCRGALKSMATKTTPEVRPLCLHTLIARDPLNPRTVHHSKPWVLAHQPTDHPKGLRQFNT